MEELQPNKGGRPAEYTDAEQLLKDGMEYINSVDRPTITRLCLHLGFESRQSFYDYEKRDGFSYSVKRLRTLIEAEYEDLITDKDSATAGVIFALKNLGWTDKTEVDSTVKVQEFNLKQLVTFSE